MNLEILVALHGKVEVALKRWDDDHPNDRFRVLGETGDQEPHFDRLCGEICRDLGVKSRPQWAIAIALAYFATPAIWPSSTSSPMMAPLVALIAAIRRLGRTGCFPRKGARWLPCHYAEIVLAHLVGWRREKLDRRSRGWDGVPFKAQRVFCNEILREIVDRGLSFLEGRIDAKFLRKLGQNIGNLGTREELRREEISLRDLLGRQDEAHQRVHGFPANQPREPHIIRIYHRLCTRLGAAMCPCGKQFCGRYHHIKYWVPFDKGLESFLENAVFGAATVAAAALDRGLLICCMPAAAAAESGRPSLENLAVWDCPNCLGLKRKGKNLWVEKCPECGREFDPATIKLREARAFWVLTGPDGYFERRRFFRCSNGKCDAVFAENCEVAACPACGGEVPRNRRLTLTAYKGMLPCVDLGIAGGHEAVLPRNCTDEIPIEGRFEEALKELVWECGVEHWMIDLLRMALLVRKSDGDCPELRALLRQSDREPDEIHQEEMTPWQAVERLSPLLWPEGDRPFTGDEFEDERLTKRDEIASVLIENLAPSSPPAPGPKRHTDSPSPLE